MEEHARRRSHLYRTVPQVVAMVATPVGGLLASEAGASGATVYAFSNNSTSHIYGGADCMTCGYIAFNDTFPSMDSLPVLENPTISPTGSSTLLYTGKDTPQQMELQDTFHFSGPSATAIALPPSFTFAGQTASWDSGKVAKTKSISNHYSANVFAVSTIFYFSGYDRKSVGQIWFGNQDTEFSCQDNLGYAAVWYGN